MRRAAVAAAWAACAPLVLGCAAVRQMTAAPDDLGDYRSFRVAAHEGRRLYEAQRYLERHPHGAFADEVRTSFDVEEPAWFEAAKTSRVHAREYLVDLPDGPHAEAARSLLLLFDEHQEDTDTLELLAAARRTAATLDYESGRRKHLGDLVLEEVAALLDPNTWGARLDAPPAALAEVLRGDVPHTWGGAPHARRQDQVFFVIPTPRGAQPREVDVALQLWLDHGRIAEGLVEGEDLFVRWAEAMLVRVLDPGSAADRRLTASTVSDLLSGAFEASLPADSCSVPPRPGEIAARSCEGLSVSVRMGSGPGTDDVIDFRAQPSAMR